MIASMADQLAGTAYPAVEIGDFASWMASEQRRIYLLCRRLLQDPEEASSATQDVFLKAYKAFQRNSTSPADLDNPGKWATRIAVNTCLDRLRSNAWKMWRRRPAPQDEKLLLDTTAGNAPGPESELLAKEIQVRLEAALNKLSPRQRAVFTLRHYDDLPLDEIGKILALDTGTVKAHLFRALAKLKEELKDLYHGGSRLERNRV